MDAILRKRKILKSKSNLAKKAQTGIDYGIDISMFISSLKLNCNKQIVLNI